MDIDGYKFEVIHSYDSHCFITIKGIGLSDQISDSDPFYVQQYVMAVEAFETNLAAAHFTADLLNKYLKKAYDILTHHEINEKRRVKGLELANMLLSKWAGMLKPVEPFYKRNGMKGLLLGQSRLLEGISMYLNLEYNAYNTFEEGVQMAIESTAEYVHLHTKAPDSASHEKDPMSKVAVFESIDKQLEPLVNFRGLLVVTADHSTPCSGQAIHSGESVPFMARGEYIRRDDVFEYNEVACSRGSVMLTAKDFMHYIHNATDQGGLYHLRAGNKWRNYRVRTVNKL
jgi:2,3-bisphosphoglycerate-independent phosphoglycerate mutase